MNKRRRSIKRIRYRVMFHKIVQVFVVHMLATRWFRCNESLKRQEAKNAIRYHDHLLKLMLWCNPEAFEYRVYKISV